MNNAIPILPRLHLILKNPAYNNVLPIIAGNTNKVLRYIILLFYIYSGIAESSVRVLLGL